MVKEKGLGIDVLDIDVEPISLLDKLCVCLELLVADKLRVPLLVSSPTHTLFRYSAGR